MWSNRMELIETCFLTNISVVKCHYNVNLCGSIEHFTPNDSVGSSYAKYLSGSEGREFSKPCTNHDNAGLMMWAKAQDEDVTVCQNDL